MSGQLDTVLKNKETAETMHITSNHVSTYSLHQHLLPFNYTVGLVFPIIIQSKHIFYLFIKLAQCSEGGVKEEEECMILLLTPLGDGNEGELRLSQSMTCRQKKCPGIGTMNTDGRNYIVTNIM